MAAADVQAVQAIRAAIAVLTAKRNKKIHGPLCFGAGGFCMVIVLTLRFGKNSEVQFFRNITNNMDLYSQ